MATQDVQQLTAVISADVAKIKKDMAKVVTEVRKGMVASEAAAAKSARNIEKSLGGAFGRVGGSLKALAAGYLSFAAIKGFATIITDSLDAAAAIKDVANAANVTTDYLQEMRFAAAQNGSSAETLDDALTKLNVRLGQFRNEGAGPAKDALDRLGLSQDVLSGKFADTGAAMDAVLKALAGISNDSDRAALAAELFGRAAGPKMAEFLRVGEAGIKAAREEAQRLGVVIGGDMINAADDASDKLNALWQVLGGIGLKAIADNAEAIRDLAQAFAEALPGIISTTVEFGKFIGLLNRSEIEVASKEVAGLTQELNRLQQIKAGAIGMQIFDVGQDIDKQIAAIEAKLAPLRKVINEATTPYNVPLEPWDGSVEVIGKRKPRGTNAAAFSADADGAKRLGVALKEVTVELQKIRDVAATGIEGAADTALGKMQATLALDNADAEARGARRDAIADDFKRGIREAIDTGDWGEAFKNILRDKAAEALDRAIDIIADSLAGLFDQIGSGSSGGGGGWLDSLVNIVGSLFGSGGGQVGGPGGGGGLGGFASGGYTGPGGKNQPAGIVHKGEYVFDQAAVNRIGVGNLSALRAGGTMGGGGTSMTFAPTINAQGASADAVAGIRRALQEQQQAFQSWASNESKRVKGIVNDAIPRQQVRTR